MNPDRLLASLAVPSLLLALAAPAHAVDRAHSPDNAATSPGVHGDLEIDPTAYALGGYSLHGGIEYGRLRIDLGVYGMKLPEFVHGNKDFNVAFDGYGAKLQVFPFTPQRGFFVDAGVGASRVHARRKGTDLEATRTQVGVGVSAGYRILLGPSRFYVTPWIGVSYSPSAPVIHLGGKTFKVGRFTPFPAVHLGYRFK